MRSSVLLTTNSVINRWGIQKQGCVAPIPTVEMPIWTGWCPCTEHTAQDLISHLERYGWVITWLAGKGNLELICFNHTLSSRNEQQMNFNSLLRIIMHTRQLLTNTQLLYSDNASELAPSHLFSKPVLWSFPQSYLFRSVQHISTILTILQFLSAQIHHYFGGSLFRERRCMVSFVTYRESCP